MSAAVYLPPHHSAAKPGLPALPTATPKKAAPSMSGASSMGPSLLPPVKLAGPFLSPATPKDFPAHHSQEILTADEDKLNKNLKGKPINTVANKFGSPAQHVTAIQENWSQLKGVVKSLSAQQLHATVVDGTMTIKLRKDYKRVLVEENGRSYEYGVHGKDRPSLHPVKGRNFVALPGSATLQLRREYIKKYGKVEKPGNPTFVEFVKKKQAASSLPALPSAATSVLASAVATPKPAPAEESKTKASAVRVATLSYKSVVAGTGLLKNFPAVKSTAAV